MLEVNRNDSISRLPTRIRTSSIILVALFSYYRDDRCIIFTACVDAIAQAECNSHSLGVRGTARSHSNKTVPLN